MVHIVPLSNIFFAQPVLVMYVNIGVLLLLKDLNSSSTTVLM